MYYNQNMKWKAEYEIGIDEIDIQHKKLIEIINKYNHSISDTKANSYANIGYILTYLTNYTVFHFKAEEKIMKKLTYPEMDEHRTIHDDIISVIREILIKMKKGKTYTPTEFYDFLMSWLNNHILVEDYKIGEYLRSSAQILESTKILLKNPEIIAESIKVELEELNELLNKKLINRDDRELRRIIYLEDLFDNYLFEDIKSFKNILKLLLLLVHGHIIDKLEKDKLYYSLLLEKKKHNFKIELGENSTYIEIDNLLDNLKK